MVISKVGYQKDKKLHSVIRSRTCPEALEHLLSQLYLTLKNCKEFESELIKRFGSLVKMPLLKSDRSSMPDSVKICLEGGIDLYRLRINRHGRLKSTKGTYAKDWSKWEKQLREILLYNADYLTSIQVPFESVVRQVLEQLKTIANGDYRTPSTEKRKFGSIVFAAVTLPVKEVQSLLTDLAGKNPKVEAFLKDKHLEDSLRKAYVTLAHKRSHGFTAVYSYGLFLNRRVPVDLTALLFSDDMAALEARPGSVDGERVTSKNQWPHVSLWTAAGVAPNKLPELISEGKATRIEISPPITISGTLEFF